jgi:hypothetical protein
LTAEKGKDLLAVILENKISLAEGTAGQDLDCIRTAGIIFNNGNQFFVHGTIFIQPIQTGPGRPETYRQTGADMSVKGGTLSEFISIEKIMFHWVEYLPLLTWTKKPRSLAMGTPKAFVAVSIRNA